MTRLLDDLRDASRLEGDMVELHLRPLDVAELARHTADTLRPLCEKRDQTLLTMVADVPLMIVADPVRLTQMLSNRLDTAGTFTDRRGRVELDVSIDADAVVLAVRDKGIGLTPAHLARVFAAFTQIERALSRSPGGLGIGLSLVRAFAERRGASVYAPSDRPGRGSAFFVRFPLFSQPSSLVEHTAANTAALSETAQPLRVLVVDDSLDAATAMAALIAMTGREVRTAQDGHSRLRAVAEFRPEVILLDLGMPRMDGFETCRRIRALEGGKTTVIIALTGCGREEDRRRTRDAGFDRHLVKPVDLAAIIGAIESGAMPH